MTQKMSAADPAVAEARQWGKLVAAFRTPQAGRSIFEIAVTVVPFIGIWVAAALSVANGYWAGLLLTIPAAAFLVRIFMLQHDCGHGSLFNRASLNNWTGRALGVLTFAPYDYWRRSHAIHHATAGNLDQRGIGDITTITVLEYQALPRLGRLRYRLYRHPLVMFGLGPAWLFLCQYRLPIGLMKAGSEPWISTIATNLAIVVVAGSLMWLLGPVVFLSVQLPILLMAATIGVWLFYVQHQFEETHWSEGEEWNFHRAAVHGSSFYDLPPVLRWLSGNIGVHHVHHLSSKIPFYRLPDVLEAIPELKQVGRITLRESLGCVKLVLWDSSRKRLVSFREAAAGAHS
ncbi:fatty acid desaturase [Tianweitania sediminis]|uniref:Fatty acid desaturase n=1 Tax=Tianweitania sediminis TaxID=1502156 RepID=A0A8J7R7Z1_9HYPH|nr:fatty acid desaturase [Tianweitania sediminis]MBP0439842.1 fatty acid desaturase [Tianweitania sediminis]